jgi:Protein of unknown function (DUF3304)
MSVAVFLLGSLLAGCQAQTPANSESASTVLTAPGPVSTSAQAASAPTKPKNPNAGTIALAMTGIDHLPDHVSIQNFWVDGHSGAQAGKGGSSVCCVRVPNIWRPGLKVTVRWGILNWRDWTGDEYETVVEVEPYKEIDRFFVHFLPDGSVRAVVSEDGPSSPDYIGPRVPIPPKKPWDVYGPRKGPTKCVDHTVVPEAPCKE